MGFLALVMSPASPAFPTTIVVTTTSAVEGHRVVAHKGIVRGLKVRMPTKGEVISDILFFDLKAYAERCEQARQSAHDLMLWQAASLGANAVIGVTYDSSQLYRGLFVMRATEILCYGTAVVIEPIT